MGYSALFERFVRLQYEIDEIYWRLALIHSLCSRWLNGGKSRSSQPVAAHDQRVQGSHIFVSLSGEEPSAKISVPVRNARDLSLVIGWSSGLANSEAQGDVAFTA